MKNETQEEATIEAEDPIVANKAGETVANGVEEPVLAPRRRGRPKKLPLPPGETKGMVL